MAKTIKFNLICDGYPVRTLDDLREHFCIDDVLAHYKSKVLHRWLAVRGFESELEKVNAMCEEDDIHIVKTLSSVFGIDTDIEEIKEIVRNLTYKEVHKQQMQEYLIQNQESNAIFTKYLNDYQVLKKEMVEHRADYVALKDDVKKLYMYYLPIFELDYQNLFYFLWDRAPVALYLMLRYGSMRKKYLGEDSYSSIDRYMNRDVDSIILDQKIEVLFSETDTHPSWRHVFRTAFLNGKSASELATILVANRKGGSRIDQSIAEKKVDDFFTDLFSTDDRTIGDAILKMKKLLCKRASDPKKLMTLSHNWLKEYSGNTKWGPKKLADSGKRCMVLWVDKWCRVCADSDRSTEYNSDLVNNHFLLLDGLVFSSDKNDGRVYYLEV